MSSNIIVIESVAAQQHVYAGQPAVFTFNFSESLKTVQGPVSLCCYLDEKVFNIHTDIKKELVVKPDNPKQAELTLTFTEASAGAKVQVTFGILSKQFKAKDAVELKATVEIKRSDGKQEVTKVYWSEPEPARWGVKTAERSEIFRNEYGFLHIHTQGLYGHDVSYELLEDGDNFSLDHKQMRDNVLSVPVSMEKVWSDRVSWYQFLKDEIKIKARAHRDKTKISEGKETGVLVLKDEQETKNPATPTRVPPVKVIIHEEEQEPAIHTTAKCSLQFRPCNTYKGEYGFDWIRMGDVEDGYYFNDNGPVRQLLGKCYNTDGNGNNITEKNPNKTGTGFQKDMNSVDIKHPDTLLPDATLGKGKMYGRLTRRFKSLIFSWPENKFTKTPLQTFVPIMTIQKGMSAILDMYLYIRENQKPDYILLEFNNRRAYTVLNIAAYVLNTAPVLMITQQQMDERDPSTNKLKIPLPMTCTGEFNDEYTLIASAVTHTMVNNQKVEKRTPCGMIRILPNGAIYQHKIKVVLVSVVVDINSKKDGKVSVGKVMGKDRINQILGQAYTHAEFEEVSISLTNIMHQSVFIRSYCTKKGGAVVFDHKKRSQLKTLLINRLGAKYTDYYKLFYINELEDRAGGYRSGYKYTVCFNLGMNDEGPVHELLHALELPHTFDGYSPNTLFTYEKGYTDNIMDYVDDDFQKITNYKRKSLYHWHWQIINPKIR